MGSYVSIYNDADDTVTVWFQLLGGGPPFGGYRMCDLLPDSQVDHGFTLSLVHQVAAVYRDGGTGPKITKYLTVWSPPWVGDYKTVKVSEIIGKRQIAWQCSGDVKNIKGKWHLLLNINPGPQKTTYTYSHEQGIEYGFDVTGQNKTLFFWEMKQGVKHCLAEMDAKFGSHHEFLKSAVDSSKFSQHESIQQTVDIPVEGMSLYQYTMQGLFKGHPITIYTNEFRRLGYNERPSKIPETKRS